MKKGIRKILAVTFGILGTALAIYVGGYLLLFRPMRHLLVGFAAGALTRSDLIISVIKIFSKHCVLRFKSNYFKYITSHIF